MTTAVQYQNRWESGVLNALGFLFLPVAVLATAQVWVPAVLGVLGILAVRIFHGRFALGTNKYLMLLMTLFIGWAAATSLWAINPDRAITTTLRVALVCISVVVLIDARNRLEEAQRRKFGYWLAGGTVIGFILTGALILTSGSGLFGESHLTGYVIDDLNRTSSAIALLVWPVAFVVARYWNRLAAAAVIVLGALYLFLLAPSTPLVAFGVGLAAFVIGRISNSQGKRFLLLLFAAAVVIVPFLGVLEPPLIDFLSTNLPFPQSEIHRIVIWQFAAERIFEQPLFGWGLDAARAIPGGKEKLFLFMFNGAPETAQAMPLHPHNAMIQIWLELGLVGVALVGAIYFLIVASIPESRTERAGPAMLIATTACAFTVAELGFGIWQGWWMATLGIVAVISMTVVTPGTPAPNSINANAA